MVVKWEFFDSVVSETYTFEVNPNAGGAPKYEKNIQYTATTAPDGKTLIMEGANKPLDLEWSGTIITETQYNAYVTWFQKKRQIQLTDDLLRQFMIYIVSFTPTRVRSSNFWKHTYTVTATVLDWP